MPKSSRAQIENDKKKVISHLVKNANESIENIAKKCGFSRQKIWRIIKDLERNNTIWGYTAIIDNEQLQKKNYIALIKQTFTPIDKQLANKNTTDFFAREAEKIGIEVENSMYVHGPYDWILSFYADDIRTAKKYCEYLTNQYSDYIKKLDLLETLVPMRKSGIVNPKMAKLSDFI